MLNRMSLINFFLTSIATGSSIDAVSTSGTFEISDVTLSGYTLPTGNCLFYVVVDVSDTGKRETFRIVNRTGSVLTFDKRISGITGGGFSTHSAGSTVQINDVAEIMNYLSSNTDDFGLVEGTTGLGVKVRGGNINTLGAVATIADATFTLTGSTTNYIVFDFTDSTFKVVLTTTGLVGILLATAVTAVSSITTLTDNRAGQPNVVFDSTFFEFTGGKLTLKGTGVTYDGFVNLVDTPNSYTGQGGKTVKVNSGETALEFVDIGNTYCIAEMRSAPQTVTTVTQSQINYDFFTTNSTGMDATANQVTITKDGVYSVAVYCRSSPAVEAAGKQWILLIKKNGVQFSACLSERGSSNDLPVRLSCNTLLDCVVGDIITVDFYNGGAASTQLENGAANNFNNTLRVYRVM